METLIHFVIGAVILIVFLIWRNNSKVAKAEKRRKSLIDTCGEASAILQGTSLPGREEINR